MTHDPVPAAGRLQADDRFVRALARRLAGDAHLGDDAAQEAWLAALQQAQAPGLLPAIGRAWLGVVARNAVLQALRGRVRRRQREQLVASERASAADGEAEPPIDGDVRVRLLAAVQALPADYRDVVRQRFFADRMPGEIADELGVPIETVRTRLKRALDRLRASLASAR